MTNFQFLKGLPQQLVREKLLDSSTAHQIWSQASLTKTPFVTYLAQNKIISDACLMKALSRVFGVPFFDLDSIDENCLAHQHLPHVVIDKYGVLPFHQSGDWLFVALVDPTQQKVIDELHQSQQFKIQPVLVEQEKLHRVLQHYKINRAQAENKNSQLFSEFYHLSEGEDAHDSDIDSLDAPVVRFINQVLCDAAMKKCSDVHFESYGNSYRIRYRQDGVLHEVHQLPQGAANKIIARLKVMSQLNVSEKRLPQDGRFKFVTNEEQSVDIRISTCPTVSNEKVVVRILDHSCATLGVEMLGFEPFQEQIFIQHISKAQGMILVTGPTGSGKTVSLYSALQRLNTPEINIATVEDPVEINLPGINQVNINLKIGLTFSAVLRSLLRQDPDVIMVGEMRDNETAEIAIKSAQTGHLVLSTLHTNNAMETLTRLLHLGILPYQVAMSVTLIVAQRLVRKLCKHCKKIKKYHENTLLNAGLLKEEVESITLYEASSCEHCLSGYQGRTGIYELLPVSEGIREDILTGIHGLNILKRAKQEGMQVLYTSGLNKVRLGITSLEEVIRLCG